MLIGLLVTAIVALFGGEVSEFVPTIPNMKKEIKRNVLEESRKDSLLIIMKVYDKELKTYEKEKKQSKKRMYKASSDRNISTEDFLETYDVYHNATVDLISTLIDYRLRFQEQVTEEELDLMTQKALKVPKEKTIEKETRKDNKAVEKMTEEIQNSFKDINEIIIKDIEDPARHEPMTRILTNFENNIYDFINEAKLISAKRMELLDDKNTSKEDLDGVYAKSNELRFQASRNYAQFREEAILNTTEKEWKTMHKDLKAFLKK